MAESMRDLDSGIPFVCLAEERLVQGQTQPIGSACLCPLSFGSQAQQASRVSAAGTCGSNSFTLNLFPTVPWFEMITTSIGRWSSASEYPGPEGVAVAEGLFFHIDACTTANQSLDINSGGVIDLASSSADLGAAPDALMRVADGGILRSSGGSSQP